MLLIEAEQSATAEIKNFLDEANIRYNDTSSQNFGAAEVVCSIILPITIAAVQIIRTEILANRESKKILVYLDGKKVDAKELEALLIALKEQEN